MSVKYAAAAACGQSHLLEGQLCQDVASGVAVGPVTAVAVSDGAGSCPSSELAAQCACTWVLKLFSQRFDALYAAAESDLAETLAKEGQAALQAAHLPEGLCTLLVAACHNDGRWLAAHIGDGYIFQLSDGPARVLSPPENGAFANETFFLCEADAQEHLRIYRGRAIGRMAVLLTSDGCGAALYDIERGAPAPAVEILCSWLADHDGEAVSQALESQLTGIFSEASEDDLSIAVLYRDTALYQGAEG